MALKIFRPGFLSLSEDKDLCENIKNIFGFYPGNIFLFKLAFRHKSAAHELKDGVKDSNERLEYLGDAILSAIIAEFLFKKYPFKDEGFLTELRSKIVNRNHLNKLAIRLGIDKLVELGSDIQNQPKSIYGDAFEALLGAIYLDKGYEFTRRIVIDNIIKLHVDVNELKSTESNFKSKLIEFTQKEKLSLEFNFIGEEGSGNYKYYLIEVLIQGKSYGRGQDFSIKAAEQAAAEQACIKLHINGI